MEGNYKKWINRINSKQDVLTEDNVGSFMDLELPTKLTPTSGDTVLARDILTNKAVEIPIESLGGGGSGLALGETSSTAYRGDRGKIAYDHSQTIGNPHGTTKNDIGLGNVDNTSDLNKPISTATQTALNNKLEKGTYTGNAQDLKNYIETKQKQLSSFDESILIETDGNIEGNVSLFTEYFQQQVCELNFIPTQIIGVYQDGIKLLPEEFNITLPKTITIITYSSEKIEIQYTHLKNN